MPRNLRYINSYVVNRERKKMQKKTDRLLGKLVTTIYRLYMSACLQVALQELAVLTYTVLLFSLPRFGQS